MVVTSMEKEADPAALTPMMVAVKSAPPYRARTPLSVSTMAERGGAPGVSTDQLATAPDPGSCVGCRITSSSSPRVTEVTG